MSLDSNAEREAAAVRIQKILNACDGNPMMLHTMDAYKLHYAFAEALAALARSQPSEWVAVASAKEVPVGHWLVYLESPMVGSHIHPARVHPNIANIGSCFIWDAPRVIAYRPMIEGPAESLRALLPPNTEAKS